jgi:hypothetical protein
MQVECLPLTSFVHDRIDAHQGRKVMIDSNTAAALEKRGFVRIVDRRVDQALSVGAGAAVVAGEAGKVPDDGLGRPSSASQVAQASPITTSRSSGRGRERHRRTAT